MKNLIACFIFFVLIVGCKKYENDTGIKLKSPQKRLTKSKWRVSSVSGGLNYNAEDLYNNHNIAYVFHFHKDGKYEEYYDNDGTKSSYFQADWEWEEGKESILIVAADGSGFQYNITLLDNHNLELNKEVDFYQLVKFE